MWRRGVNPPDALAAPECSRARALPVAMVIENLEDLSIDEVVEQFDVTREQVMAVLEFVAESLRAERSPTGAHPLRPRNAEGISPCRAVVHLRRDSDLVLAHAVPAGDRRR